MAANLHTPNSNDSASSLQNRGNAKKLGSLALLAVETLGGYWLLGDRLTFEYLATQEAGLHEYRQSYPFFAAKALRRKEEKALAAPTLFELSAFA
jgi:hypothetical protein